MKLNDQPFSIGVVSTIVAVVSGVSSATGKPIGATFGFHDIDVYGFCSILGLSDL